MGSTYKVFVSPLKYECRHGLSYSKYSVDYSDIEAEQKNLNQLYDAFTKKYGIINDRANNSAFSDDESYPLLCSLEVLDENLKFKAKADMFSKRTINAYRPITHADTASDALAVSIGGDSDTIAAIAGSIAESFYPIPEDMKAQAIDRLPEDMKTIVEQFYKTIHHG